MDSTQRFSDRVENYVRYRPGYPGELLHLLDKEAGLTASSIIADVGSGTGISAKLFLDHGNEVFAVEPNTAMRAAAEKFLSGYPRFHSVDGMAERTTLAEASVDHVVAGQAFHWFDRAAARKEFLHILRPTGWTVLVWNERRVDTTPFLRDYEALINEFAIDYRQVDHRNIDEVAIGEFLGPAAFQRQSVENSQNLDLDGLIGRIESSSYMPGNSHPKNSEMLGAVRRMFDQHERAGSVEIEYDTVVYFGRLS